MRRHARLALSWCLAVSLCGHEACTPFADSEDLSPEAPDESTAADASHDDGVTESVDVFPADDNADARDESDSDLRCPEGFIYIDFPCSSWYRCEDDYNYRKQMNLGCADVGFDPECCSGATCTDLEIVACPEGTLCVEPRPGGRPHGEPCRTIQCGGIEDPECPERTFCERPAGQCDGRGVCVLDYCAEGVGHSDYQTTYGWQCGCDGVSYPDFCSRQVAGTSLADGEPCCDASRLELAPDNPERYTKWVACMLPDGYLPEQPDDVATLLILAHWYPLAEPLGCLPGEIGVTGQIHATPGNPPSPERYLALCRLASAPAVRTLFGISDYQCDDVPPYPWLSCRNAGNCPSPCGCSPCTDGDTGCGQDLMMWNGHRGIIRCEGSCWSDPEWCPPGMQCIDDGGDVECGYSCDSIQQRWQWLADTEGQGGSGYCETGDDCKVLSGQCDTGLGPCWFAFADSQDLNESQIHEMADAWQTLGCGTSIECDCGPPPQPKCFGFSCGLPTSL